MFVSESTLLLGTRVQILSFEGALWEVQLERDLTVDGLKSQALAHFYPGSSSSPENFRVIHSSEFRTLGDNHFVQDEKLKDNDVLLFVRRRSPVPTDPIRESDLRSPKLADIIAATKDLPSRGTNPTPPVATTAGSPSTTGSGSPARTVPESSSTFTLAPRHLLEESSETELDFQLELRKILISLINVMATILNGNPDAETICHEVQKRVKHRISNISQPEPDDPTSLHFPPLEEVGPNPRALVRALVEIRKREYRVNPKAVSALKEMGFKDNEIYTALRVNRNDKEAAARWLVSVKRPISDEMETGLDPTSTLFNALVTNPTIRLGLNNPKTLLAFFGILESPGTANAWLNDSDTAPVLSAIFKIFHSEKHSSD